MNACNYLVSHLKENEFSFVEITKKPENNKALIGSEENIKPIQMIGETTAPYLDGVNETCLCTTDVQDFLQAYS